MSAATRRIHRVERERARLAARIEIARLARVPSGHKRVWFVLYRIGAKWQSDGEWFTSDGSRRGYVDACAQARTNARDFGWPYRVVPLDLPACVFADSRRAGGPNARARRQREAAESFRGPRGAGVGRLEGGR